MAARSKQATKAKKAAVRKDEPAAKSKAARTPAPQAEAAEDEEEPEESEEDEDEAEEGEAEEAEAGELDQGATLGRVVALLEHEGAERRAAAAIVLGELRASSEEALAALRKATRRADDAALRRWAAEALGSIAPRSIIQDLKHLLKDPDLQVRESAKHALASGKGVTAEDVASMLESKDDKQRSGAIAVLGAMGTPKARRAILAQLEDPAPRVFDAVRDAMLPILRQLEGDAARTAIEEVDHVIEDKKLASVPGLAALFVDLVDAIHHEAAAELLARIAGSGAAPEVRASALNAMRRALKGKKATQKLFRFLLELMEGPGTPAALFGPAAETLAGQDVPLALEARVRALIGAEQPVVRRWAIRALGALDTAPAAKAIAKAVEEGDATDREVALEAALSTASGRAALAKLLAGLTDEGKARLVAGALKPRLGELTPASIRALEEAVVEAAPAVSSVIIELLRHGGGESAGRVQETLFDKAIRLKKRGQFGEAAELFRRLAQGNQADAEARYHLGICELKLSKRVLSAGAKNDPCLSPFHALARQREFPLIDRLRKEKIPDDELYYLGFALAEGNQAEQALGGDVLMLVADVGTDAKLKKMAENKLKTMGFLE